MTREERRKLDLIWQAFRQARLKSAEALLEALLAEVDREHMVEDLHHDVAEATANPKDIAGSKKAQLHLIPHRALLEVARVMKSGADKYGAYNWREKPITHCAYVSANGRHMGAHLEGQTFDPESGLHHVAHAAATNLILLDAMLGGSDIDDRPRQHVPSSLSAKKE